MKGCQEISIQISQSAIDIDLGAKWENKLVLIFRVQVFNLSPLFLAWHASHYRCLVTAGPESLWFKSFKEKKLSSSVEWGKVVPLLHEVLKSWGVEGRGLFLIEAFNQTSYL